MNIKLLTIAVIEGGHPGIGPDCISFAHLRAALTRRCARYAIERPTARELSVVLVELGWLAYHSKISANGSTYTVWLKKSECWRDKHTVKRMLQATVTANTTVTSKP